MTVHDRDLPTPPGAPGSAPFRPRNRLLHALSPPDFALLGPYLERVSVAVGDPLAKAGDPILFVHFPEDGIAGVTDALEGDGRYAIGLVGNEGFTGWPLLLGDDVWPYDIAMRAERGEALRIAAEPLLALAHASESLRDTLLRFALVFMTQMGRTIVSALAHPIERRLARWILLYHDRVHEDDICMTHEEFRLMLGVRRSSITDALHRLEEEGAVRSLRSRVVVRDRSRLLLLAGDTYGHSENQYRRLFSRASP